jgi:hypothetical protein
MGALFCCTNFVAQILYKIGAHVSRSLRDVRNFGSDRSTETLCYHLLLFLRGKEPAVLETITAQPQLPRKPRKRRSLITFVVTVLLLCLIVYVVTSKSPFAQGIQEMAGWRHDQTILDASFSLGPHTFRYYKFSVPQGSANIAIVGQFTARSQSVGDTADNGIEVYVLTDAAFSVWQSGQPTSSLYDSSLVSTGTVKADIPAGAGVYYLVFSNKYSPRTAKTLHATVQLRSMNWLRRVLSRHN